MLHRVGGIRGRYCDDLGAIRGLVAEYDIAVGTLALVHLGATGPTEYRGDAQYDENTMEPHVGTLIRDDPILVPAIQPVQRTLAKCAHKCPELPNVGSRAFSIARA
jgi:hypothetical protein